MRLIRYTNAELKTRGINHRVGTFRYKDLGEGLPGTPGNFYLRMVWSGEDFFSPRHLHNFDQVRVQIEGEFDFAGDGSMKPGDIGYFPEGTPYGPQTSQKHTVQLVLQIGGPSGSGYISQAQRVDAVESLSRTGQFSDGRYFAGGGTGSTGIDGFQAAWEEALGRKMVYPPRRFQKPVLMDPEALAWEALPGQPGVDRRQLWRFGRQAVAADLYRAAPGAALALAGPATCFVKRGAGHVQAGSDGHDESPGSAFESFDVVHIEQGESVTLRPREATQLLVFRHPLFAAGP